MLIVSVVPVQNKNARARACSSSFSAKRTAATIPTPL
jgi:hypothetical protein